MTGVAMPSPAPRRALVLAALAACLAGCRDSPAEVLETATEAAAQGDLAAMQETFSAATIHRLERAWSLEQKPATEGWQALAAKLVFQGRPLEVLDEKIHGDYARVDARAGVEIRPYYLRKEDGRWRIELGAGLQFRKAAAAEGAAAAAGDAGAGS